VLTNVAAGSYTLTARATDNCGNMATSAPVNISVVSQLPLTIVSSMRFNPQTGLFEQTVRVFNPTTSVLNAVRVYVSGLTNNAVVYNPSGSTNSISYVQSAASVPPGSYVDFVIEYYVPSRIAPNPILIAELVPPANQTNVVGVGHVPIERALKLPNGTFLLEFSTQSNRIYYIKYSSNLVDWKTAQPAIIGNGSRIQWIDNGQPKTESHPSTTNMRFYRLIVLP
jgi:hypothetical protein